VSKAIRAEFENGRDYYALDGTVIREPPSLEARPAKQYLEWLAARVSSSSRTFQSPIWQTSAALGCFTFQFQQDRATFFRVPLGKTYIAGYDQSDPERWSAFRSTVASSR
jgi:hypothetical protein